MTKLFFTFAFLCTSLLSFAQDRIHKLSFDFDGDGTSDVVQIKGEQLCYSLSSLGSKEVKSQMIGYEGDMLNLELKKNVVVLTIGFMRATNTFKFRYDAKLKQFKMIGYDNEQYGNAVHDGAGASSYNVLTGDYEAQWSYYDEKKEETLAGAPIRQKLAVKTYLLKDFGDKVITEMYDIDAKYAGSH
jgi:hypothetical protein